MPRGKKEAKKSTSSKVPPVKEDSTLPKSDVASHKGEDRPVPRWYRPDEEYPPDKK